MGWLTPQGTTHERFAPRHIADEGWVAPRVPFEPPAAQELAGRAQIAALTRAIEHEIIPRLMLAHRVPRDCLDVPGEQAPALTEADVERFTRLVLEGNDDTTLACVEDLRLRGVTVESLYVELLAPCARRLGTLWTADLCSFTDVTLGLGRLHQLLRHLSPELVPGAEVVPNGLKALLVPGPGEQHTFGLVMVAEFFRRDGWEVSGGPWEEGALAAERAAQEWFDVIGFSLAAEVHLDGLARCIREVRRQARNSQVGIMVGGPVFASHPEYVRSVEADIAVGDGRQAPALARELAARALPAARPS